MDKLFVRFVSNEAGRGADGVMKPMADRPLPDGQRWLRNALSPSPSHAAIDARMTGSEPQCQASPPRGRLRRGQGRKERVAVGGIREPVAPAFAGQVVTRVAANQEAVLGQAVRAEAVLGHIDGCVANGLLKEPLPVRIRRA